MGASTDSAAACTSTTQSSKGSTTTAESTPSAALKRSANATASNPYATPVMMAAPLQLMNRGLQHQHNLQIPFQGLHCLLIQILWLQLLLLQQLLTIAVLCRTTGKHSTKNSYST